MARAGERAEGPVAHTESLEDVDAVLARVAKGDSAQITNGSSDAVAVTLVSSSKKTTVPRPRADGDEGRLDRDGERVDMSDNPWLR